jgi:hypothetical protein
MKHGGQTKHKILAGATRSHCPETSRPAQTSPGNDGKFSLVLLHEAGSNFCKRNEVCFVMCSSHWGLGIKYIEALEHKTLRLRR